MGFHLDSISMVVLRLPFDATWMSLRSHFKVMSNPLRFAFEVTGVPFRCEPTMYFGTPRAASTRGCMLPNGAGSGGCNCRYMHTAREHSPRPQKAAARPCFTRGNPHRHRSSTLEQQPPTPKEPPPMHALSACGHRRSEDPHSSDSHWHRGHETARRNCAATLKPTTRQDKVRRHQDREDTREDIDPPPSTARPESRA